MPNPSLSAEAERLQASRDRAVHWKRWGPYLSERQWGTVREDYSANGDAWNYLPHDHARSRAYRWGEDGIAGFSDRHQHICFALAMWNEKDPILKERLFGLNNREGNHGEDVKEYYYYLVATPTSSYLKYLYKYPQREFPYEQLLVENGKRTRTDPEYELIDTGIFAENRYFDVQVEYAKAAPNDILIEITVTNRGPEPADLHLLPTLWFRNTWSWGCSHEGCAAKPRIKRGEKEMILRAQHESLGSYRLVIGPGPDGRQPPVLFTENETNQHLWGSAQPGGFAKDAFHEFVVGGKSDAVNPKGYG